MRRKLFKGTILILLGIGVLITSAISSDALRITKDQLKALLGHPDLLIVDVRSGKDWIESDLKIKGAAREEPDKVESWANKYSKGKIFAVY